MILNKKKGVVFPYLIALFMIVLFFTFLSFFIHKPQSDINRLDYGALTKSADIQQNVILSYSYTYDEMVDRLYNQAQSFFLNFIVSHTEAALSECSLEGDILVFDARTEDSKNSVYEICLEILVNKDQDLADEFRYEELFRVLVDNYLANIYVLIKKDIDGFDIVSTVDFREEENIYNVEIEYLIDFNSNIAKGSSSKISKFEFYGGSFLNMIETMVEEIPNLNDLNSQISSCMTSGNYNKESCIENSMGEYLRKELTEAFSYEVEFLGDLENSFYQVRVDVFEKSRLIRKPIISFAGVFEDRAPLEYPSFNLALPRFDEGLFQVEIEKPQFNLDILDGFLILYSYDRFLVDKYADFENSLLLGDLRTLTSSKRFEIKNYEGLDYEVFSVDDVNGLTAIYLENNNLDFKDDKLIVPINQIYNSTSGNFELLENKQINVFVFSLRDTQTGVYNYLINPELIRSFEAFTFPSYMISLPPIDFNLGNLQNGNGLNFGVNLSFSNYNYEYDQLEFFITEDRTIDFRECELIDICNNLQIPVTKTGDYSFLLYSSENEINQDLRDRFDFVISDELLLARKLQSNEELYFLVVASSPLHRSPFDSFLKRYQYEKEEKLDFSYFKVNRIEQDFVYRHLPEKITIRELNP